MQKLKVVAPAKFDEDLQRLGLEWRHRYLLVDDMFVAINAFWKFILCIFNKGLKQLIDQESLESWLKLMCLVDKYFDAEN